MHIATAAIFYAFFSLPPVTFYFFIIFVAQACTPALCKIARGAGQAVPDWLAKFEGTKANKQWRVEDVDKAITQK